MKSDEETPEGLLITIRRGKTDQEGLGRKVAIPRGDIACPVEAVRARREAAGISQGALFRRVWSKRAQRVGCQRLTARIVADIVKAGASRPAGPGKIRRPQPPLGPGDHRRQARCEPAENLRPDRPQVA
jgi:hypothetical protein